MFILALLTFIFQNKK
ncbi:hypothetical protein [Phascolarctobacterium succinatutens]